MKKKSLHFQTKLILIQIFLVLPILALVLFVSIYWIRSSAIQAINNSRNDSLQTAASSFDQSFSRMIKLLEKPYTDEGLYDIISTTSLENGLAANSSKELLTSKLLNNIIYYEPDISSVTLVLDATNHIYYKRRAPSVAVNVHNPDWYNPTNSSWYLDAMETDNYVIAPASIDELYLNSGVTIPIYQRLLNVDDSEKVGVFRIDLGLQNFYSLWRDIVQHPTTDMLMVLDSTNQLVYCSSESYLSSVPLLTPLIEEELLKDYHLNAFTSDSGVRFLYLSTSMPVLDLKQPLYVTALILITFYLFYAFMLIRWSSRYLSNPIHKLKAAMIQGQNKNLSTRCESLNGEMGELSDSFNILMERMELLIHDATHHEQEKAQLAYEILQSKVNPHFLYNTLNAIRCKADMIGATNISHALESLGSLLRFTIKCTDDVIPFGVELSQLEHYIHIMRIRYGDQIEFNFDIDENCFQLQCLKFLLQPMVENCFIHAFHYPKAQQNIVTVKVQCKEDSILVLVEDNGDGMSENEIQRVMNPNEPASKTNFFGIGIPNVRQRIEMLFGSPYTLWIESEQHAYTKVYATIPRISLSDTDYTAFERNPYENLDCR